MEACTNFDKGCHVSVPTVAENAHAEELSFRDFSSFLVKENRRQLGNSAGCISFVEVSSTSRVFAVSTVDIATEGDEMNSDYVFLCGVMWCRYGQQEAGRELLRAALSRDPDISTLALAMFAKGKTVLNEKSLGDHQAM